MGKPKGNPTQQKPRKKGNDTESGKVTKGKVRYKIRFQAEWKLDPAFKLWLRPVASDATKAFCGFCRSEFSIAASGVYGVKTHANGVTHQRKVAEMRTMQPIGTLFQSGNETIKVICYLDLYCLCETDNKLLQSKIEN